MNQEQIANLTKEDLLEFQEFIQEYLTGSGNELIGQGRKGLAAMYYLMAQEGIELLVDMINLCGFAGDKEFE